MDEKENILKEEITDRTDSGYTKKVVYRKFIKRNNNCLSAIIQCDKNDKYISRQLFKDDNFKELFSTTKFEYNEDETYTMYIKYIEHIPYGSSEIIQYDKNNKFISSQWFIDDCFKNISSTTTYQYNEDETYTMYTKYIEYIHNVSSEIVQCDRNDKYISEQSFKDKDFKDLSCTAKFEYNEDESYTIYVKFIQYTPEKFLSIIIKLDRNDKYISAQSFKDNNFKDLSSTATFEYNPDGSFTKYIKNTKPNSDGILSQVEKYDENDKCLSGQLFKDKDFKDLSSTVTIEYNPDGSYTQYFKYTEPDSDGDLSAIEKYGKNDKCTSGQYFKDDNFKNLSYTVTREYNPDGSYTKYIKYTEPDSNGVLSAIEKYDKKLIVGEYFKDDNFKNLSSTVTFKYNFWSGYTQYFKFTEVYLDNILSMEQKYNRNDECILGIAYKDKDFKNIYRKSWLKNKKEYILILRFYPQTQGDYNIEIEKLDKNKNVISKKEYNLPLFIAKILFLFKK